jgi:hypothetical protein
LALAYSEEASSSMEPNVEDALSAQGVEDFLPDRDLVGVAGFGGKPGEPLAVIGGIGREHVETASALLRAGAQHV